MKKVLLILSMASIIVSLVACTPQVEEPEGEDETTEPEQQISAEERQRADLYIAVMEGAFREENCGYKPLKLQNEF